MTSKKITIDLNLNCSKEEALDVLYKSVECIFLPWFLSQSKIKGFVSGNTFYIWPNTLYSKITDMALTGRLDTIANQTKLIAYSRILPPFKFFQQSKAKNWGIGVIMIIAWMACTFALITEKTKLAIYSAYILMPSILYLLIQFNQYIQEPELLDMEKRLKAIFANYIKKS